MDDFIMQMRPAYPPPSLVGLGDVKVILRKVATIGRQLDDRRQYAPVRETGGKEADNATKPTSASVRQEIAHE
jgi:hypothetical protein